jgi:hypothetical protein
MQQNNNEQSTGDITGHPKYIKGYQRYLEHHRESEEKSKDPWMQGWTAAAKDVWTAKALAMDTGTASQSFETPDDKIEKLQQEIIALDERLRKLEKYTES